VHRFFLPHVLEHPGCRGILLAQRIGKVPVNAPVLFLRTDGNGQNFFFGQVFEFL